MRRGLMAVLPLLVGLSLPAAAVDSPPSDALPDLSAIRAVVYSGRYEDAAGQLADLSATVKHADIFNLLGYSLRNLGRNDEAGRAYAQALYYDPAHRPALEYQGELFITLGDLEKAQANVDVLRLLCPQGCAELDTLEKAVAAAGNRTKQ